MRKSGPAQKHPPPTSMPPASSLGPPASELCRFYRRHHRLLLPPPQHLLLLLVVVLPPPLLLAAQLYPRQGHPRQQTPVQRRHAARATQMVPLLFHWAPAVPWWGSLGLTPCVACSPEDPLAAPPAPLGPAPIPGAAW